MVAEQAATIEKLGQRVDQLERKLAAAKKNSSNSSKPPSSDIVKKPKGKGRGRQKGNRKPGGHVLRLAEPGRADLFVGVPGTKGFRVVFFLLPCRRRRWSVGAGALEIEVVSDLELSAIARDRRGAVSRLPILPRLFVGCVPDAGYSNSAKATGAPHPGFLVCSSVHYPIARRVVAVGLPGLKLSLLTGIRGSISALKP